MDRNAEKMKVGGIDVASLSARRAWIEIIRFSTFRKPSGVALRKESVDRNKYVVQCRKTLGVALRKESVDRNAYIIHVHHHRKQVALRKESVDRNMLLVFLLAGLMRSLSARRAWIEIHLTPSRLDR